MRLNVDSNPSADFAQWWFHGCEGVFAASAKASDTARIVNRSESTLNNLIKWCLDQDVIPGHQSVWMRATTLRQHPAMGERGDAQDTLHVPGLWADLDIGDDGHKGAKLRRAADVAEAISTIAHLPAPSLLVHTGGGLSAWWKFDAPLLVSTPTDLQQAQELAAAWQRAIIEPAKARGILVDNVRDLARIMRLPGTTNRKITGADRPCTIIEGGTGSTYLIEAMQQIVEQARAVAPTSPAPAGAAGLPIIEPTGAATGRRRYTLTQGRAELERRAAGFEALTTDGNQRHNRLAGLGLEFGRAVAGGFVDAEQARTRLMAAARTAGFVDAYGEHDAATQVERGIADGAAGGSAWVLVPELVITADDAADEVEQAEKTTIGGHMGLARRFAHRYTGTFRYVSRLGWYVWAGTHWVEDQLQTPVRAYRDLLDHYAALADRLDDRNDSLGADDPQKAVDVAAALRHMVERNTKVSDVRGVLALAQAETEVVAAPDWLNRDAYLFATPAGTLDLRQGCMRAPDPADLITKCAGAGPDPAVDPEPWRRFVERVLPDPAVRGFVQRLFGSALVGKQVEHVLPVFHGLGANGKGVFQEVMMALFGTYATALPADSLLAHQHARHRSEWIPLMGARLAFASETEAGRRFNAALVKALVGGDPITANKMREDPVTWLPTHLLILLTNDVPAVDASDAAMWRRVCIVPFDVVIPEEERDGHLPEKLIATLPAVAEWVWQGFQEYQRTGLAIPDAVRARTASFRADSDVLGEFLAATVEVGSHADQLPSGDLFLRWSAWCDQRGQNAGSAMTFAATLAKRGWMKQRTRMGMVWEGWRLTEAARIVEPAHSYAR